MRALQPLTGLRSPTAYGVLPCHAQARRGHRRRHALCSQVPKARAPRRPNAHSACAARFATAVAARPAQADECWEVTFVIGMQLQLARSESGILFQQSLVKHTGAQAREATLPFIAARSRRSRSRKGALVHE